MSQFIPLDCISTIALRTNICFDENIPLACWGEMDLGLNGQVALVTASGRGLGLAIAQELAQEGVRVVLAARSAANLAHVTSSIIAKTGAEIVGLTYDGTRT